MRASLPQRIAIPAGAAVAMSGVVLATMATCLTFLIRDVTDNGFDWRDYVLAWLGAALAMVNRARQGDVEGFPTFGP